MHIFYPIFDYTDFLNLFKIPLIFKDKSIIKIINELIKIYDNKLKETSLTNIISINHLGFKLLHHLTKDKEINIQYAKNLQKIEQIMPTLKYIEQNWNKNISTATLAKLVYLSPSHFVKIFRETMNVPPLKYQMHKRIQNAINLLRGSKHNISEIAIEVGFEDQFYFSRKFKTITGISPLQYRQNK